jgi:hypothetical protein
MNSSCQLLLNVAEIETRKSQVIVLDTIGCGQERQELLVVGLRRWGTAVVPGLQDLDGEWRRLCVLSC